MTIFGHQQTGIDELGQHAGWGVCPAVLATDCLKVGYAVRPVAGEKHFAASRKLKWRTASRPMTPSTLAPPITTNVYGKACLTLDASAREAICC